MQLLFKQRLFSWFDSNDIYDEAGNTVYTVQGQLAWGHCLKIFDADGTEVGTVKEKILSWMPKFELYLGDAYIGCINREFAFFKPKYHIECNDWQVEGDFFGWDYSIFNSLGAQVAVISKQLLNWTDTYTINVPQPQDALLALMLVLAIDADKCSHQG